MILFRILLWIIGIPFLLLAYLFKLLFTLFVELGTKIIWIIGGLVLVGGIFVIIVEVGYGTGENTWSGILMIIASAIIAVLPFIAVGLVAALNAFIEWLQEALFN